MAESEAVIFARASKVADFVRNTMRVTPELVSDESILFQSAIPVDETMAKTSRSLFDMLTNRDNMNTLSESSSQLKNYGLQVQLALCTKNFDALAQRISVLVPQPDVSNAANTAAARTASRNFVGYDLPFEERLLFRYFRAFEAYMNLSSSQIKLEQLEKVMSAAFDVQNKGIFWLDGSHAGNDAGTHARCVNEYGNAVENLIETLWSLKLSAIDQPVEEDAVPQTITSECAMSKMFNTTIQSSSGKSPARSLTRQRRKADGAQPLVEANLNVDIAANSAGELIQAAQGAVVVRERTYVRLLFGVLASLLNIVLKTLCFIIVAYMIWIALIPDPQLAQISMQSVANWYASFRGYSPTQYRGETDLVQFLVVGYNEPTIRAADKIAEPVANLINFGINAPGKIACKMFSWTPWAFDCRAVDLVLPETGSKFIAGEIWDVKKKLIDQLIQRATQPEGVVLEPVWYLILLGVISAGLFTNNLLTLWNLGWSLYLPNGFKEPLKNLFYDSAELIIRPAKFTFNKAMQKIVFPMMQGYLERQAEQREIEQVRADLLRLQAKTIRAARSDD